MKKAYDYMDGHDFETYCAKLLKKNGFHKVEVTRGSGDQGIDILACKNRKKYGIQCKCYSHDLGNKAVQEAYAGMKFYGCDVACVLTNQYFTNAAVALAEKTDVLLWDRTVLNQLRQCRKPRFLTGLGALSAMAGAWLFYFLYASEGFSAQGGVSFQLQYLYCILVFMGGLAAFFEKGSRLLSVLATLFWGSSILLGICLLQSLGGLLLLPMVPFFFSFLRNRKLRCRTNTDL